MENRRQHWYQYIFQFFTEFSFTVHAYKCRAFSLRMNPQMCQKVWLSQKVWQKIFFWEQTPSLTIDTLPSNEGWCSWHSKAHSIVFCVNRINEGTQVAWAFYNLLYTARPPMDNWIFAIRVRRSLIRVKSCWRYLLGKMNT